MTEWTIGDAFLPDALTPFVYSPRFRVPRTGHSNM